MTEAYNKYPFMSIMFNVSNHHKSSYVIFQEFFKLQIFILISIITCINLLFLNEHYIQFENHLNFHSKFYLTHFSIHLYILTNIWCLILFFSCRFLIGHKWWITNLPKSWIHWRNQWKCPKRNSSNFSH